MLGSKEAVLDPDPPPPHEDAIKHASNEYPVAVRVANLPAGLMTDRQKNIRTMTLARVRLSFNSDCESDDPVIELEPSVLENSQPISTAMENRSTGKYSRPAEGVIA